MLYILALLLGEIDSPLASVIFDRVTRTLSNAGVFFSKYKELRQQIYAGGGNLCLAHLATLGAINKGKLNLPQMACMLTDVQKLSTTLVKVTHLRTSLWLDCDDTN